jgi:hypothetical protein
MTVQQSVSVDRVGGHIIFRGLKTIAYLKFYKFLMGASRIFVGAYCAPPPLLLPTGYGPAHSGYLSLFP